MGTAPQNSARVRFSSVKLTTKIGKKKVLQDPGQNPRKSVDSWSKSIDDLSGEDLASPLNTLFHNTFFGVIPNIFRSREHPFWIRVATLIDSCSILHGN